MDLTTKLRYIRLKQKGKKLAFLKVGGEVQRKRRNRISLKTEQDKVIKRPTWIVRKGVGFFFIEDVAQSGSQATGRKGE